MKTNIGTLDRILRLAAGIVLIALAIMGPAHPWGYIGIIPLLTGLVSFCPLYSLLGICTTGKHPSST